MSRREEGKAGGESAVNPLGEPIPEIEKPQPSLKTKAYTCTTEQTHVPADHLAEQGPNRKQNHKLDTQGAVILIKMYTHTCR